MSSNFFGGDQKILVAYCSPHRKIKLPNGREMVDTITVDWHRHRTALATGTNCNFIEFFCDGYEIGEGRDLIVKKVLEHEPRPEFIFWLDDDVLPSSDAFVKLLYRARCFPEYDLFAGVYACKGIAEPLIYAGNGIGPFWDWAIGDLLTTDQHGVTGCHSGLTLVRTSLYQRMLDNKVLGEEGLFYKTVNEVGKGPNGNTQSRQGTEDLYFCHLAQKANSKFMIDTSVLAGHICKKTGITWGLPEDSPPVKKAKWLRNKDKSVEGEEVSLKIALDLGYGGHAREWPGYKTYNTDIRADTKPDYVQDTLYLNLPNDHFDLVASSHHLEHLGRWDQEKAWSEIFRICKPGGLIEHIVPSLEWAAAKINENQTDVHVMNVLYGAQEGHGYERQYNLHYFGYTKGIAKALAENAGFVDVEVKDWRDNPELAYELYITGRKPVDMTLDKNTSKG